MTASPPPAPSYRRAVRLTLGVLVVYLALVAVHAHQGEFWPFSIYPMFSQAGKPWSRAVVRHLPAQAAPPSWAPVSEASGLQGAPYALEPQGLYMSDVAHYVAKTERWDAERLAGLRRLFDADALGPRALLLYRARGRITPADTIALTFEPYVWLTAQGSLVNPSLPR